jgi:hypothetical protein
MRVLDAVVYAYNLRQAFYMCKFFLGLRFVEVVDYTVISKKLFLLNDNQFHAIFQLVTKLRLILKTAKNSDSKCLR